MHILENQLDWMSAELSMVYNSEVQQTADIIWFLLYITIKVKRFKLRLL